MVVGGDGRTPIIVSVCVLKTLTLLVMASEMDPESWGGADYARPLLRLQEAH